MARRPQCGRRLISTHAPGQNIRLLGCAIDTRVSREVSVIHTLPSLIGCEAVLIVRRVRSSKMR